jgi:lantibiotic biosynthesis protein
MSFQSARTNTEVTLQPIGVAMVRTPLLPIDFLQELFLNSVEYPVASDSEVEEIERNIKRQVNNLNLLIERFLSNPIVQEAILTSSSDLSSAIPRWLEQRDSKKGRQAGFNIARYLMRMATRPTPFGILAGVASAQVGYDTSMHIMPANMNVKRSRPDMQWILAIVREAEARLTTHPELHIKVNSIAYVSGNRLIVPHLDTYGQEDIEKTVSLRSTPLVLRVLELAHTGTTMGHLKQTIKTERPNASEAQIDNLLQSLHSQNVLISDIRPPLTKSNPIAYVLEKLSGFPGCLEICAQLSHVSKLLQAYDATPIGHGSDAYKELQRSMTISNVSLRSALEVDMATRIEAPTISRRVVSDIADLTKLLARLSVVDPIWNHLSVYRREFREKYGEDMEVPLLNLLDPDTGLGPPPTYAYPPAKLHREQFNRPEYPKRDRLLMEIAASAARKSELEVEFDEAILTQLEVHRDWQDKFPNSVEIYASVAAHSEDDIEKGNYRVVIGPSFGAYPAGKSFGRFMDILDDSVLTTFRQFTFLEQENSNHCIIAELVYVPNQGHFANVAIRPGLFRFEIAIGTEPGVQTDDVIPASDLLVGIQNDRFYLRSISRNVEVVVRSSHMLSPRFAPNICRLLTEISMEGHSPGSRFDWGAATKLPFVPRVGVGRVIISVAEWHFPINAIGIQRRVSPAIWYQIVQGWRKLWNMPRFVYLAYGDNRLLLDLESAFSIADFGNECWNQRANGETLTLQEVFPSFDDAWASGDAGRYFTEFIVPFQLNSPQTLGSKIAAKPRYVSDKDRLRALGSDWLYAKLYANPTFQNELLAKLVFEMTSAMSKTGLADRWFFIRYSDPEPHIRFRIHGDPNSLLLNAVPMITQMANSFLQTGMLQKVSFDCYEREVARYGGEKGLQIAEDIFWVDSIFVTEMLRCFSTSKTQLTLHDLALRTVDSTLAAFGCGPAERKQLYDSIWRRQAKLYPERLAYLLKTFHEYRKVARKIISDLDWLKTQFCGDELGAILDRRTLNLVPLSVRLHELAAANELNTDLMSFVANCIHMHCNRLGLTRRDEFEINYFLARTLESIERFQQ